MAAWHQFGMPLVIHSVQSMSNHRRANTCACNPPLGPRCFFAIMILSARLNRARWMRSVDAAFTVTKQWFLPCFLAVAILVFGATAHTQPASSPASSAPHAPAPLDAVTPIPLVEVAADAESVSARMREMQAESSAAQTAEAVAKQLPALTREIDAALPESRKIIAQRPSIEILAGLEAGWWRLGRNLYGWTWDLTRLATKLEEQLADLDELGRKWEPTLEASRNSDAPPETVRRIQTVIAEIRQAREAIERRRARVLTMQNRVAAQEARIADALRSIATAREEVLKRLFVKDSSAIWSAELRSRGSRAAGNLLEESRNTLATQWAALRVYAGRETIRFLSHAAIFIALAAALYRVRRWVRFRGTEEVDRRTAVIFAKPVAAAAVLSVLCSLSIYPEAPRLWRATLLALALIPSVVILRPLVERELYPTLYALVAFYFIDQVRALTAAVELLPRLLFLGEMIGAMLFSVWLIRAMGRPVHLPPETARGRTIIKVAACAALAVAAVCFVANIGGYVTLADLLGNALVRSAYFALILYTVVEVVDGLFTIALGMRPLALLGTVSGHRALLRRRVRRALRWLAVLLWILVVLDRLLLRERLFSALREVLTATLTIGSLNVSLGDVLAFGITVWAAFLVSRFIRFLLDEDVYPRVHLTRGLPYAISTMLHYVILVAGFFVAVAALGFDMTKVTILAGAFSVGVGFGLQNVFNNFVSGIILLFERPVKVGDVVQIEDASGVVEHIGIRASIIRTPNGSEIIVPNGKLISERVINWTLSNRQHSIELPVTVAQGNDPTRVITLLERTAAAHPLVAGDPPPQALVVKLGPDSLGFELRAWSDHIEQWMQIRSELAITISAALAAEKIPLR